MTSIAPFTPILLFCLILLALGFLGWVAYAIVDSVKSTRFEVRAQVIDKLYEPPMKQFIKEWRGGNASAITPVQFPESHQLVLEFKDGRRSLPVSRSTYERFRNGDRIVLSYRRSFLTKDVRLETIAPADQPEVPAGPETGQTS